MLSMEKQERKRPLNPIDRLESRFVAANSLLSRQGHRLEDLKTFLDATRKAKSKK